MQSLRQDDGKEVRVISRGILPPPSEGYCMYAWSEDQNKWVQIGVPNCSSGKMCPHSSDVQYHLSDQPHSGQYELPCVSPPGVAAARALVGPLHVGASGTCTYAWSDDLDRWVEIASNCSSNKMCPHSSDVQYELSGQPHSGQYLLPCVSAPHRPSTGTGH